MNTPNTSTPTPKENPKSDGPTQGSPNTQSTKPAAPGAVSKPDPDNDALKKAAEGTNVDRTAENKARATELPGGEADPNPDPEFEKALAEKDGTISAQEQAEIDAAMGNEPMAGVGDFHPEHIKAQSIDPLQPVINSVHSRDRSLVGRLEQFVGQYKHPVELITQMVRDVAPDTPDEHIVWGASGHILRYGHLRALVMGIDRPRRD